MDKELSDVRRQAIHRGFRPQADATVVCRLREAGAVILGKLQLTEGAYSDYHRSITGLLLQAIAGSDPADPTALLDSVPNYLAAAMQGAEGWRIGIDAEWNEDDVDASTRGVVASAAAIFLALGAEIVEVSVPDSSQVVVDWVPNCAVEAAVAHGASNTGMPVGVQFAAASLAEGMLVRAGAAFQRATDWHR